MMIHGALVPIAYWFAFQLRFDFNVPDEFDQVLWQTLPILLVVRLASLAAFHVFSSVWHYISVSDLIAIGKATVAGTVVFGATLFVTGQGIPRSVYLIEALLSASAIAGARLATRALREARARSGSDRRRRALVVGAGAASEMLIRDLHRSGDLSYEVVGLLDDDPRKQRVRIHGVPVVGVIDDLQHVVGAMRVEEVLIAIPSADEGTRRRIAARADLAGVTIKTMPSTADLLTGRARLGQLVSAAPQNLLGRDEIQLDTALVRASLRGKRILVTGAGGSIGSELCRQIAPFGPATLVMLDRAESALFLAAGDITRMAGQLDVRSVVSDITDRRRMAEVFDRFRPEVVFHAAAYKHVSLMEEQPLEAITNNVFGTETIASMALERGVERFVMISTDKAVRPVGVMGMTKRVAEDLLLTFCNGAAPFVAVRFGNVLGSDGSVLPIFERQLAAGGPITVTDPSATRYFMLASEAAQLVLQAGTMGSGGEVFFLDMGEPVQIGQLAENFIRLSGLTPHQDIKIEVIGLRNGERLNEELVRETEEMRPSPHGKILIVQDHRRFEAARFRSDLETLRDVTAARDNDAAVAQLRRMAASY